MECNLVTRQAHIDDVFQPKQTDEDIEDLDSWEDEEEFTDSDGSGTGNESSMDESESSLYSEVERHFMANDVAFNNSSSSEQFKCCGKGTTFIKERFDISDATGTIF